MRQDILDELDAAFGQFKFFPSDHHYECYDERVGISVTRLIEEYCNEFNAEEIAEKVAARDKKTTQEVLLEWSYKNEFACIKGSNCHDYAQCLWSKDDFTYDPFDNSPQFIQANKIIQQQAENFKFDFDGIIEHLAAEYVVGSEEYDIASAIDHLFINVKTGGLILVDYKTNSYLGGYNDDGKQEKYAKSMKVPLHHLKDLTINHYYIQLSIYKFLVEKYTNLKIENMFIVYMSENIQNYQIIKTPYLKDEVVKILENRRKKDMNSVPILLIGKSGSGKSTSLRNFTKEEVAVVNVLGKPLPFKSDINAPKCDDYATILKAIATTKKKTIVIDDANYLITNEFMNQSTVKGFDKYNTMANNFFNLINGIKNIEGGKTVYLIMHEDSDDEGNVKPKTIGKLLDDKVNIQGMFTICIRAMYNNGNYIFRLKTNGSDCVKTPFGMFDDEEMENDLKAFDKVVREYYGLDKNGGSNE